MDGEQEQSKDNIAKQIAINQEQKNQIENLQAKINSFSNNQSQLVEKSRFKASSYMNEINQREEELGRVRANLVDMQEENKQLTVTREKFKAQNVFLAKELKTMELEFNQQKKKIEEQQRLIDNLCVTQKVQNQSLIQSAGCFQPGQICLRLLSFRLDSSVVQEFEPPSSGAVLRGTRSHAPVFFVISVFHK